MPDLPSRRRAAILAVLAAALALAGCASVPSSGSVHIGRTVPAGSEVEANDIRIDAAVPYPGITPVALVSGFLSAVAESDGNYAIARLYLAGGVSWHPAAGAILYDAHPTTRVGAREVDVDFHRVGVTDARGVFRVAPGTLRTRFTLVRQGGQWRISRLPAEILLSTLDAERNLQPVSVYYLDRSQTRLVPEPILVPPDAASLATTLVRALIDGPGSELAAGVVSAVPHGTYLIGNVTVGTDDAVAEVDLGGTIEQVSGVQLQRLSAQIVWTLRQVPSVTGVRLLADGAPLPVTGVPAVQPIGGWPQFDPQVPPSSQGALFSDHGRVAGLNTAVPLSLQAGRFEAPALSADGSIGAALRAGRRRITLLTGSTVGRLRPRLSAAALSAPTFDPQGDAVVVRGVGAQSRLVEVTPGGAVRPVAVPAYLRAAGISQISISRDGSRIAMVVGAFGRSALVVGTLGQVRGATAVVTSRIVIPSTADVSGAAWGGADEILTTLAGPDGRRSVVTTTVDGYQRTVIGEVGLPPDPTQVADAPGQPMLVGAAGAIWELSGQRWHRVSAGSAPSYAG